MCRAMTATVCLAVKWSVGMGQLTRSQRVCIWVNSAYRLIGGTCAGRCLMCWDAKAMWCCMQGDGLCVSGCQGIASCQQHEAIHCVSAASFVWTSQNSARLLPFPETGSQGQIGWYIGTLEIPFPKGGSQGQIGWHVVKAFDFFP